MAKTFITKSYEGEAAGDWDGIQAEAGKHRRSKVTVEDWSEARELSEGQRNWWKGVLLPALHEDTGDSIQFWETTLKLAVLPDDFQPIATIIDGIGYTYIPSIKTIGLTKMNIMVEGSVAHLRGEKYLHLKGKKYGDQFQWVTLPDKLKKRRK